MATGKAVSAFFCQNCGYESSKWMGQCPACHEWNSFVEEPVIKSPHATGQSVRRVDRPPVSIDEIKGDKEERFTTDIEEFDRVLGGGIVPGSLVLVEIPVSGNPLYFYRYVNSYPIQAGKYFIFQEKNHCRRSRCVLTGSGPFKSSSVCLRRLIWISLHRLSKRKSRMLS